MKNIIEKILDIENQAQKILKDSKEKEEHFSELVRTEIESIYNSLCEKAENELISFKKQQEIECEEKLESINRYKLKAIERLNKVYSENKRMWTSDIIKSITGDDTNAV